MTIIRQGSESLLIDCHTRQAQSPRSLTEPFPGDFLPVDIVIRPGERGRVIALFHRHLRRVCRRFSAD